MNKSPILLLVAWLAVAGNLLFFLWILYNGISSGFAGTPLEKLSYITLLALLVVNALLIVRGTRPGQSSGK